MQESSDPSVWQVFDIGEIEAQRAENGGAWLEFLRVPDLFAGVYSLRAGSDDGQSPHDQDELYYILAGSGTIEVDGESRKVGAGAAIYVRKHAAHRFVDITDDLRVLVFFANGGDG